MPTTGKTALNDQHFRLFGGRRVRSQNFGNVPNTALSPIAKKILEKQLLAVAAIAMKKMEVEALITVIDQALATRCDIEDIAPERACFSKGSTTEDFVGVWQFREQRYFALLDSVGFAETDLSASFFCQKVRKLAGLLSFVLRAFLNFVQVVEKAPHPPYTLLLLDL